MDTSKANTTSIGFPNMFNVSTNSVAIKSDADSIVNRVKLLLLTEPQELYMNPTFGVGLKRHLFQYNTENQRAILRDNLSKQLALYEPYVKSFSTSDGLLFSETASDPHQKYNKMELTIGLTTTFNDDIEVKLNDTDTNNFWNA